MNTEDKIYSKIKNASQNGEKDFPGMDKVWNRVEEKLDNTLVVKKKNTWQKLAIAASVLLSFSIIYHFVSKEEVIQKNSINNSNPVIVSNDSVKKIMEKAKEVVVENDSKKKKTNQGNPIYNSDTNLGETSFMPDVSPINAETTIDDSAYKIEFKNNAVVLDEKETISPELNKNLNSNNAASFRNSASNYVSTDNGYLAKGKKYEAPTKEAKSKSAKAQTAEKSDDIILINGVVADKKDLENLNADDIEEVTHLKKPLYIINGIEYTEESLFGKKPTSPYAPLDKQEIITLNVIKDVDAMKVYGKKGENGVIIITTKDGKPVKK